MPSREEPASSELKWVQLFPLRILALTKVTCQDCAFSLPELSHSYDYILSHTLSLIFPRAARDERFLKATIEASRISQLMSMRAFTLLALDAGFS